MSIGIFGGSFDPPHICHVLVCQYVLAMSEVERILVIPSSRHPFNKAQTSFEQIGRASCRERVSNCV